MQEANNVIVFHDYGMAAAFTLDFNQMWGSSTATPNAATSKMGAFKVEVIPHQFEVGGIRVEGYMSPLRHPRDANDPVHPAGAALAAVLHLRLHQRSAQPCDARTPRFRPRIRRERHVRGQPGGAVLGVVQSRQFDWSGCTPTTPWTPRADVFKDVETQFTILHHKYQIFDEGWPAAAVWTGSHNWSSAAKTNNDENIVVVHDPTIANLYYQEWTARYRASGGTTLSVDPVSTPAGIALAACRPNPSAGADDVPVTASRATRPT
jgi:hypothetical protein